MLDLSKALMYDFHYNCIKLKYGEKAKLLCTGIDSFCYEIETEDFYKDIYQDVMQYNIYRETINKVADLSGEDDKREIPEDGIHTPAHGYFKLSL